MKDLIEEAINFANSNPEPIMLNNESEEEEQAKVE